MRGVMGVPKLALSFSTFSASLAERQGGVAVSMGGQSWRGGVMCSVVSTIGCAGTLGGSAELCGFGGTLGDGAMSLPNVGGAMGLSVGLVAMAMLHCCCLQFSVQGCLVDGATCPRCHCAAGEVFQW